MVAEGIREPCGEKTLELCYVLSSQIGTAIKCLHICNIQLLYISKPKYTGTKHKYTVMKVYILAIGFGLLSIPLLHNSALAQPQFTPMELNQIRNAVDPLMKFPEKREEPEFFKPSNKPILTIIPADPDSYKCTTKTGYSGFRYSIKNDDGTYRAECISRQENYDLLLKQMKKK